MVLAVCERRAGVRLATRCGGQDYLEVAGVGVGLAGVAGVVGAAARGEDAGGRRDADAGGGFGDAGVEGLPGDVGIGYADDAARVRGREADDAGELVGDDAGPLWEPRWLAGTHGYF